MGTYENFLYYLTKSINEPNSHETLDMKKKTTNKKIQEYQEKKYLYYTSRMTICEI